MLQLSGAQLAKWSSSYDHLRALEVKGRTLAMRGWGWGGSSLRALCMLFRSSVSFFILTQVLLCGFQYN